MEGDEQITKDQLGETGQNSADFFINNEINKELEKPLLTDQKPRITMREKVNTVLVVIVAIFAVFLGYYQLSYNISHPFTFAETPNKIDPNVDCPGGNCDLKAQLAAVVAAQNKDTDGDGLTDIAEINTYKSSPFLEDSDSDGINDGDEVKQGTNPNCPEGQNCFTSGSSITATGTVPTLALLPAATEIQITPAAIRDALRQGGFSDEYLSMFTDADLITMYQEVLKSEPSMTQTATGLGLDLNNLPAATATGTVNINTSTLSSTAVNFNIKNIDDLRNLTGAQIRQLMIGSGAPESVLSQVSDEELKAIFLEKLNAKNASTPVQ